MSQLSARWYLLLYVWNDWLVSSQVDCQNIFKIVENPQKSGFEISRAGSIVISEFNY